MPNTTMTLPALLRHQATTQADAPAFTFMDGAVLGTGHPETLTWNQLYRRVLSLAEELRRTATKGDRVAILAPQGLDYVVAFYASLQAGMIAVPLSVPMFGVHDQRVESALGDSHAVGAADHLGSGGRRQQVRQSAWWPARPHRHRGGRHRCRLHPRARRDR